MSLLVDTSQETHSVGSSGQEKPKVIFSSRPAGDLIVKQGFIWGGINQLCQPDVDVPPVPEISAHNTRSTLMNPIKKHGETLLCTHHR